MLTHWRQTWCLLHASSSGKSSCFIKLLSVWKVVHATDACKPEDYEAVLWAIKMKRSKVVNIYYRKVSPRECLCYNRYWRPIILAAQILLLLGPLSSPELLSVLWPWSYHIFVLFNETSGCDMFLSFSFRKIMPCGVLGTIPSRCILVDSEIYLSPSSSLDLSIF